MNFFEMNKKQYLVYLLIGSPVLFGLFYKCIDPILHLENKILDIMGTWAVFASLPYAITFPGIIKMLGLFEDEDADTK